LRRGNKEFTTIIPEIGSLILKKNSLKKNSPKTLK
jgi:hypothetical protein